VAFVESVIRCQPSIVKSTLVASGGRVTSPLPSKRTAVSGSPARAPG
jgi:hypothetical protein